MMNVNLGLQEVCQMPAGLSVYSYIPQLVLLRSRLVLPTSRGLSEGSRNLIEKHWTLRTSRRA